MAVKGIPVVIAENGKGTPIRQVQEGDPNYGRVPLMTVAENGFGLPIVLSDLGAPARVEGEGVPGFVGLTSSNVAMMRAAREAVTAGTARGKIAFAGSSSFAGPGLKATSIPTRVAEGLAALGVNAEGLQSLWATANYFADPYTTYDPRVAGLGNWSAGSFYGPGGPMFTHLVATTTNDFAFTPPLGWDNARLWYSAFTPAATINIRSDGVLKAGAQSLAGTNGNLIAIDITDTLGVHTISMAKTTGTSNRIQLAAIDTWNSAAPAMSIYGMGWGGSRAADWAETTYQTSPRNMLATLGLDGLFMLNGLNEWLAGVPLNDFLTAYEGNVVAAQAYCDVVCCIPQWSDPVKTGVPLATQALYRDGIKSIAVSRGAPYFDFAAIIGDFAAADAAGYYDGSGYHLTDPAKILLGDAMAYGISGF